MLHLFDCVLCILFLLFKMAKVRNANRKKVTDKNEEEMARYQLSLVKSRQRNLELKGRARFIDRTRLPLINRRSLQEVQALYGTKEGRIAIEKAAQGF